MNRIIFLTAATIVLLTLSACDRGTANQTTQSNPAPSASTPWVLTSAPQGAISITQAKATAKEGDQVIIQGRIGGRKSPISADSPVFTIVDMELPYCGQHNDDNCSSPWDYCCETPDTITANAATVQIVVGDPSTSTVDPVAEGFEPLDEVILVGTIGPRPDDQVLVIQATSIYKAN
ncbi:MAG: hypothetical protein AB8C13_11175 [Phycisphaerales bacterium]